MPHTTDTVWSLSRNDAVWAHRSHPASFWLRLVLLLAFGATLWLRERFDPGFLVVLLALVILAWVSERAFPVPADAKAWATRATWGERLLGSKRPLHGGASRGLLRTLAVVGSLGTIVMVSGAIVFDPVVTLVGVVVMLVAKLAYFDRLARAYDATAAVDATAAGWAQSARA